MLIVQDIFYLWKWRLMGNLGDQAGSFSLLSLLTQFGSRNPDEAFGLEKVFVALPDDLAVVISRSHVYMLQ